jgi:virulence-associated protein VagC
MNWALAIDGLFAIAAWMLGSLAVALTIAWAIRHFFPRRPEDDYAFTLKSSDKKATVVLPPDLPEAEQQERMRQAYQKLGVPPMPHYPVPIPEDTANLWRLRRHTTKAFRSGNSQAIPIPPEIAYGRADIDLDIQRVGDELRIRPATGDASSTTTAQPPRSRAQ